MTELQAKLGELRDKGWTLAAIADEVGAARRTVDRWYGGELYPRNAKSVLVVLSQLAARKRVPPKRRAKNK